MRILFVCSGNSERSFQVSRVFIYELQQSLINQGVECDIYLIQGKGLKGYLSALIPYWRLLFKEKYDLIHSFYGLSGLFASLRFGFPVVISFIGSDINVTRNRMLSRIAICLSNHSIFVSEILFNQLKPRKDFSIIPFGIDLSVFKPLDNQRNNHNNQTKTILFASSFSRPVKNFALAKRAVAKLSFKVELIEMGKNYSRDELNVIFNKVDLLLLTSFYEGSPQVIKEAMACNCPIVATDVGDIKDVIGDTENCFVTGFDATEIAMRINQVIEFGKRTNGREKIKHLDNKLIASRIIEVYNKILKKKNHKVDVSM